MGMLMMPVNVFAPAASDAVAACAPTQGCTASTAQPKKRPRPSRKNRQAFQNKQLASRDDVAANASSDADLAAAAPAAPLGTDTPRDADAAGSADMLQLQAEGNALPVASTVAEPETPTAIIESTDGQLLTVMTFEREACFRRGMTGLDSPHLHPLVRDWLTGLPLVRLVGFDREKARGKLGRTPTIIRGLGLEIMVEGQVLKVHYAEHGDFIYTRPSESPPEHMPSETPPSGPRQPLVWLPRQFSFQSPALKLPLPNIVADWVQTGRRLTPRNGGQVVASGSAVGVSWSLKRLNFSRHSQFFALLACSASVLLLVRLCSTAPKGRHVATLVARLLRSLVLRAGGNRH